MRVLIHDYGGYAFPIQLSRALAARGYQVIHAYCGSLPTTPQAQPQVEKGHLGNPEFVVISLEKPLAKYSLVRRWLQETQYGRHLSEVVDRFRPDVVISGNTPLDAQKLLLSRCRTRGIKFVFWVQDLLGVGAYRILKKKIPFLGHMVGGYYIQLERSLLRRSDKIVLITEDFRPLMRQWGIDEAKIHVIPNWAPLEEIPLQPKNNDWARLHQLHETFCFLYAGTLGLKHNPELLVKLALRYQKDKATRVVVVSQGLGADYLKERKAQLKLDNLLVLGYQPYEQLPQVLGAADVLVALLEPDAGVFSVPSKVLTYLCAGRPLLLAVPPDNLAARIVFSQEAGLVVHPRDVDGFLTAADALFRDQSLREKLGRNARIYAEQTFDIEKITDQFEAILQSAIYA
jgi:colanic acid biosynthesis glycosyl transferase WcaI